MAGLSDIFTALNNIAINLGKLIAQTALQVIVPVSQGGTGAVTAGGARTNLGIGNIANGPSAGLLDLFAPNAALGKTEFSAANNVGNTTTTILYGAQAGARIYTTPDQGGNASYLLTGATLGASGLAGVIPLPLLGFKNSDGTTLATAAAAGKFGLSVTAGTSMFLVTEAANANTKTDIAIIELVLPPNYIAGQNITVTANGFYIPGTGTVGTHTLAAAAHLTASDGSQGATLIATAAQTIPASVAGDMVFAITGATLAPNSRLLLVFTLVIQETAAGGNITAHLDSVRVS